MIGNNGQDTIRLDDLTVLTKRSLPVGLFVANSQQSNNTKNNNKWQLQHKGELTLERHSREGWMYFRFRPLPLQSNQNYLFELDVDFDYVLATPRFHYFAGDDCWYGFGFYVDSKQDDHNIDIVCQEAAQFYKTVIRETLKLTQLLEQNSGKVEEHYDPSQVTTKCKMNERPTPFSHARENIEEKLKNPPSNYNAGPYTQSLQDDEEYGETEEERPISIVPTTSKPRSYSHTIESANEGMPSTKFSTNGKYSASHGDDDNQGLGGVTIESTPPKQEKRRRSFFSVLFGGGGGNGDNKGESSSSSSSIDKKHSKDESLTTDDVGRPENFQHLAHIGFNPVTGRFDVQNIPPEWRSMFQRAGVTTKDLQTPQTAAFIADFVVTQQQSTPAQLDRPVTKDIEEDPQSIIPPQRNMVPSQPPPPPPPAPKREVNTAPTLATEDKSRNQLLESIRSAGGPKALKPTPKSPTNSDDPHCNGRNPNESRSGGGGGGGGGDMASLLATALAQRKKQQQQLAANEK